MFASTTDRIAEPARSPGWLRALAGPALIIGVCLIVLRPYVFDGRISNTNEDPLAFVLPMRCYGSAMIRHGVIPGWNPHVFAGTPFAADPQSGWMYLEHMLVFAVLPCGAAIRWLIVLNPMVAGLGLYGFLRSERVSRTAATLGGTGLALSFAAMQQVISLPGEGSLGWTTVLLLTASRFVQASSWTRRLAWAPLVALAWGELASAHLTHGLAMGTFALVLYLAFRLVHDVRRRRLGLRTALVGAALLLAAIVTINVAILLPRVLLVQRTSVAAYGDGGGGGGGYESVGGTSARWPFKLAEDQGAYLGGLTLCLALAAPWSRRSRYLTGALATFAAVCYVIGAQLVPVSFAGHIPLSNLLYLHSGRRFAYGVIPALAALAAIGLDAWLEEPKTSRRIAMLIPGVVMWFGLSRVMGVPAANLRWLVLGGVGGAALLFVVRWRPELAILVPVVVAVELTANALVWQTAPDESILSSPEFGVGALPYDITAARAPTINVERYLQPGAIAETIASGEGRYLTSVPPGSIAGPLSYKLVDPSDRPALAAQQSMLFDLEEGQGYNPVQLRRFWDYVRVAGRGSKRRGMAYRVSYFIDPPEQVLDLLDVNWLIAPDGSPPTRPGWIPAIHQGTWSLYRREVATPRASLLYHWSVVPGDHEALARVTDPAFDPDTEAILEQEPGIPQAAAPLTPGSAEYTADGTQGARIDVSTPQPAVLLVRNAYDSPWRATVDGTPADVLVADSTLQGVVVPAGQHVVEMHYDDRSIALSLAFSILALVAFEGLALASEIRDRRRTRHGNDLIVPTAAGTSDRVGPSDDVGR